MEGVHVSTGEVRQRDREGHVYRGTRAGGARNFGGVGTAVSIQCTMHYAYRTASS